MHTKDVFKIAQLFYQVKRSQHLCTISPLSFCGLHSSPNALVFGTEFTLASEPEHLCRAGHVQSPHSLGGGHSWVPGRCFSTFGKGSFCTQEEYMCYLPVIELPRKPHSDTRLELEGESESNQTGDWQESKSCQLEIHSTNSSRAHLNILQCIRSIKALQIV